MAYVRIVHLTLWRETCSESASEDEDGRGLGS